MKSIKNDEYYEAKFRLGLLSVGDPGAQDKVQVNDTFLVSAARRIDTKIKSYPRLKSGLVYARNKARTGRNFLQSTKKRLTQGGAMPMAESRNYDDTDIQALIQNISFKKVKKPKVSIIIPAFNKAEYSAACLVSIAKNLKQESPSYEVILVDNGSSDSTHVLKNIKNIVYIHNETNLGFVGGCNTGLARATGEYVVYLNNDAEVDANWLITLYDTIKSDPSIGMVGSKIVYPNGVLQEAGGIIFKDAGGLNYGKFDSASSYQYNYVRDVDYCSGASIIIRRALMNKFGGFDKLYQPAYYEDTDLSFKVRKEGLRVIYQPDSVIYHIEGGTAGTDTTSGYKKFQVINKAKFEKRWSKILKSSHVNEGEHFLGRDRSGDKLALIIEESVPTPDKDSGSVRMVAMIKGLKELGYKVTFWPNDLKSKDPYTHQLQQLGVEVVYGDVDFMQFSRLYGHYFNLVIMSRPEICARYVGICRNLYTNASLVYDTVDLHYVRLKRQADIETANKEQLLEQSHWYEILEKGLMERVDATIVVSEKEVEILKSEGVKEKIAVVSNIHEINEPSYAIGFEQRKDIVFVGNYAHLPNRDAIKWFVSDIFPDVLKAMPNVKLHIVGANMPPELERSVSKHGVIVDGYLSDDELSKLLDSSRVFIAPLRYGAGVKGKIGQAIERGIPVVTTSIGAEGMYLKNGDSCIEGDTPEDFSDGVIAVYRDEELWTSIRGRAKKALTVNFSRQQAKRGLKNLL